MMPGNECGGTHDEQCKICNDGVIGLFIIGIGLSAFTVNEREMAIKAAGWSSR